MIRPLHLILLASCLLLLPVPLPGKQKEDPADLIGRLRQKREALISHLVPVPGKEEGGKCGFGDYTAALELWSRLGERDRGRLREALSPLQMQKDRVIGRFHFFYDTAGFHEPALLGGANQRIPNSAEAFVDSAGRIFNDVWEFETGPMGYAAPPLRSDSTYHVTILNLGPDLYGRTVPDLDPIPSSNPPRYATSIDINSDFQGVYFPSRGMPALKVTAAHEFHHAIQVGSYGFWGDREVYFYEITSTWMEDVVYNDVNDYLQYLSNDPFVSSQFSHPELRFTRQDRSIQYSRAIWGKFLEKRFSRDMMRRIWENMRDVPSLPAMDRALLEAGSTFRAAFREFASWNLRTGPSADTGRYYSEGRTYPQMRIAAQIDYVPPERSYDDDLQAVSSTYYQVCILASAGDSCRPEKQMLATVSNFNTALAFADNMFAYTYIVSAGRFEGSKALANGLFTSVRAPDTQNWSSDETIPAVVSEVVPFPNPSRGHSPIWFRLPVKPESPEVVLTVFSSDFDRVFSGVLPVGEYNPSEFAVQWDGRAENGARSASGIYLFVVEVDGRKFVGKFSMVRE